MQIWDGSKTNNKTSKEREKEGKDDGKIGRQKADYEKSKNKHSP